MNCISGQQELSGTGRAGGHCQTRTTWRKCNTYDLRPRGNHGIFRVQFKRELDIVATVVYRAVVIWLITCKANSWGSVPDATSIWTKLLVQMVGMDIPVSDAKALLSELVRRAEHGEDVVLTRHGLTVARLIPVVERPSAVERRTLLNAIRTEGRARRNAWSVCRGQPRFSL